MISEKDLKLEIKKPKLDEYYNHLTRWSKNDQNFLYDNQHKKTVKELSFILSRTPASIRAKLKILQWRSRKKKVK